MIVLQHGDSFFLVGWEARLGGFDLFGGEEGKRGHAALLLESVLHYRIEADEWRGRKVGGLELGGFILASSHIGEKTGALLFSKRRVGKSFEVIFAGRELVNLEWLLQVNHPRRIEHRRGLGLC